MSINIETVAEKTFNVLKGFGYEIRSFDKDGNQVINPKEATRFANFLFCLFLFVLCFICHLFHIC